MIYHKLCERQVRLFLLNRLRKAKEVKRYWKQYIYGDVGIEMVREAFVQEREASIQEREANNCYRTFCESLDENYVIPAFVAKESLKKAKTLYGDYK